MTHPVLKLGHANDHDYVVQAQQMLQMVRSPMDTDDLPQSGEYDAATEQAVLRFQQREGLQGQDGVVGPETWGALWEAVRERQQQGQAQEDLATNLAPQEGGHTPEAADPPPTLAEVDHGRALLDYYVDIIAGEAHEFAEAMLGLGPASEVLPKLIDAAHTGVLGAEIFGVETLLGSAVAMGTASALGTVIGPLAMWVEAVVDIQEADDKLKYRWAVYRSFMAGFWAGLHDQAPAEVEQFFVGTRDKAYSEISGHTEEEKKGIRAILAAVAGAFEMPTDDNPTLTPEHWALCGPNNHWTWNGLESVLSQH